jgi:hypothetical protein
VPNHQPPEVNYLDCFKIREIACRVKAEPLLCRVNFLSEIQRCSSLHAAGGQPAISFNLVSVLIHPRVELRANFKLISHRCLFFEVEFVWELTPETIHLPLGCLQGGPQCLAC